MEYSEYITNEKLERDVLMGRANLPKELEYSFNPDLATNNVNTYYYIIATSYGNSKNINKWVVNNRLFFNLKDAESFKTKMMSYNLEFGNIYQNKDYLLGKIIPMNIDFNTFDFDHKTLYAMWLNDKTTKLTPERLEKAKKDYKEKVKSILDTINKSLKEKRRESGSKDDKIDYLTYYELCYLISFYRYHPDIFFIYNAQNMDVDYEIKDIQLFI